MMTAVSVTVPLRTDRARAVACLAADPTTVLGDEVGVDLRRGPAVRQDVAVQLGGANTTGDRTSWPLSWEPVGHARTLPAFSGTLEVRDTGDATALHVSGSYRPPLGLVGIIVDSAIGHRVAEASIEHFASSVARRLDRAAMSTGVRWAPAERPPDRRPV
jgi:hypothetical protein